jgi:hypothetical protein
MFLASVRKPKKTERLEGFLERWFVQRVRKRKKTGELSFWMYLQLSGQKDGMEFEACRRQAL